MWATDVEKNLDTLKDLSLLEEQTISMENEDNDYRYFLTPFMLDYIEKSIDKANKTEYMVTICHYYAQFLWHTYYSLLCDVQQCDIMSNSNVSHILFSRFTEV